MKKFIWILACLLSGCGLLGIEVFSLSEYGSFYKVGELINTGCASVVSFDPRLRSTPHYLDSPDTYIGYIDYGHGSHGSVFTLLPGTHKSLQSVGEELVAFDPRHEHFWSNARLLSGTTEPSDVFVAFIPSEMEGSREIMPQLVQGRIVEKCGKKFLVSVHANPKDFPSTTNTTNSTSVYANPKDSPSSDVRRLKEEFSTFESNIRWSN